MTKNTYVTRDTITEKNVLSTYQKMYEATR